ncbi:SIR2 family protein [Microbacterium sp. PF5]|uniref:SIR2 family protein n=1 Tax=Microbacterium sp. PF5 TaxID=2305435 RepID=UPI00109B7E7B|nr:SIR2 family protein [Microbacterium sp. PF5]
MTEVRNVAVLVGNGLSIAFNPALNLRAITTEMVERMKAASDEGDDVVTAMKEIAERALPAGVTSEDDFEVLVGAFGAENRTMGYLERLAALTQPQDDELQAAIQLVANFAARVRDTGLSHVLQVIFENSHAYADDAEHLHSFVTAVTSSFDGRVSLSNLNYDTLLLSAVLTVCNMAEVADLADGRTKVSIVDGDGDTVARVPLLRETRHDFSPKHRVLLLHLHGSITYWAGQEGTVYAKLSRDHLEDLEQWQAVRDGTTGLRPVVVLANQRDKSAHVQEFPFSLAYEMFVDSLATSNHWLIVGYSFRDEPVNAKLQAEFNDRAREEKPRVLVVTHGDDLAVHVVERAFGWGKEDGSSVDWLTVVRTGANGVENTAEWAEFIA